MSLMQQLKGSHQRFGFSTPFCSSLCGVSLTLSSCFPLGSSRYAFCGQNGCRTSIFTPGYSGTEKSSLVAPTQILNCFWSLYNRLRTNHRGHWISYCQPSGSQILVASESQGGLVKTEFWSTLQ